MLVKLGVNSHRGWRVLDGSCISYRSRPLVAIPTYSIPRHQGNRVTGKERSDAIVESKLLLARALAIACYFTYGAATRWLHTTFEACMLIELASTSIDLRQLFCLAMIHQDRAE